MMRRGCASILIRAVGIYHRIIVVIERTHMCEMNPNHHHVSPACTVVPELSFAVVAPRVEVPHLQDADEVW